MTSSCPTCGLRQWKYNDEQVTCKNGHRYVIGMPVPERRPDPRKVALVATAIASPLTLALDLLIRGLA